MAGHTHLKTASGPWRQYLWPPDTVRRTWLAWIRCCKAKRLGRQALTRLGDTNAAPKLACMHDRALPAASVDYNE